MDAGTGIIMAAQAISLSALIGYGTITLNHQAARYNRKLGDDLIKNGVIRHD